MTLVRDLSHRRSRRPSRELWRKVRFAVERTGRRWSRCVPRCRVETKPCGMLFEGRGGRKEGGMRNVWVHNIGGEERKECRIRLVKWDYGF